jgi:hypothetical protein
MPDVLTCPRCKRKLSLRDDSADEFLTCPRCLAYVPNPHFAGRVRSSFDRDFRLDSRGGAVLILVLAGLIVVGGFGLLFANMGLTRAETGAILLFGAGTVVPVVLGALLLYASGVSRALAEKGPVIGTVVLAILLTALVLVSAVIIFFAVCFYAVTSH